MSGSKVAILQGGVSIGSTPAAGAAWVTKDYTGVATFTWSERYGTREWGGPLAIEGSGYLGLRFVAGDGIHYGWLFAELATNSIQTGPRFLNWAYESRPNTPILAGAVPTVALNQPQLVRANQLRLSWQTETNRAYQIQSKAQIDDPWISLDFSVIGSSIGASIDLPITNGARFFRIVRVE